MSDKLLTEDELKIIRKTMAETETQKKKQEDLKTQKKKQEGKKTQKKKQEDLKTQKKSVSDTTKLDLTSLIPRLYSILTKEELDIIRKTIAEIEAKK